MVEVQNLFVGYGETPVLSDISLAFPPGQVTGVLGPNGCGKSTLLKAALGLIPIQGGQVLVDGKPLSTLPPRDVAQRAAYLAQSRSVPSITARRMVLHGRFPYLSYPRRYRPEDYQMADQALQWADAADLSHRLMEELSGGQRQKVYLAMALAQDTQTIFMDEPTTFLDISHQLEVMALARRLAAMGRAVVLVLHDLSLALRGCDRIALLSGGALRALGSPEEVFLSGVLDEVFQVRVGRMNTEEGWQYYCSPLPR
ncbi:ABC transporter ATP-binding protein [Lawsonibacter sp. LCP25S3_G6]|uniref:ABC transporter ATP-binding protein n=1 Tax=unclassified Lawsonibacter TaxID=2617946 RepID=UPI003F95BC88